MEFGPSMRLLKRRSQKGRPRLIKSPMASFTAVCQPGPCPTDAAPDTAKTGDVFREDRSRPRARAGRHAGADGFAFQVMWILGPNGFHRHFAGNAEDRAIAAGHHWEFDRGGRLLRIETGPGDRLIIAPNADHQVYRAWRSGPVSATRLAARTDHGSVRPLGKICRVAHLGLVGMLPPKWLR